MNRERDGMRFVSLPENIKLEKHSFVFRVLSQAEELLHFLRAATKPESPMQARRQGGEIRGKVNLQFE